MEAAGQHLDDEIRSPSFAPTMNLRAAGSFPPQQPLEDVLTELYAAELTARPDLDYLREHGSPGHITSHVAMFRWYWPWIRHAERVLDWGCQHGPDAVLLRRAHDLEEEHTPLDLFGCDFSDPTEYVSFRSAARLQYVQLRSLRALPYEDASFDAVIAAGVLEHVASDLDSLREVHRVLRPGGRLVVTYLPSATSVDEYFQERRNLPHHERRYTRRMTRRMLMHSGFRLLTPVLYQTPAWQHPVESRLGSSSASKRLIGVLRTALPVQIVRASTFCLIAERAEGF
jgi:SAM-dependent methyltransferase